MARAAKVAEGAAARAREGASLAGGSAEGEASVVVADGNPAEGAASGHFMYVLACADGTLYTGYAVDVAQRVAAHNAGKGAKYTRPRRPVRLLAAASFATKHDAMSAEARFKRLNRAEKEALVGQAIEGRPFESVLAERFGLAQP